LSGVRCDSQAGQPGQSSAPTHSPASTSSPPIANFDLLDGVACESGVRLLPGYDVFRNDIRMVWVGSSHECMTNCQGEMDCKAWTLVGSACYMKSDWKDGFITSGGGLLSGVLCSTPCPSCSYEEGIDLFGMSVGYEADVASKELCCDRYDGANVNDTVTRQLSMVE